MAHIPIGSEKRDTPVDDLETQRQDALDTLAARYAEGVFDEDTFERALTDVRAATDQRTLSAAVRAYLPAATGGRPSGSPQPDPGQSVTAILTERTVSGDWIHHRAVTATTVMGSLTLDLRDVVLTEDTRLHVVAVMGELKILLPRDVAVHNEVSAILAEHPDHSRGGSPRRTGSPALYLTGTAILAEVTVY